MAFGLGLGFMTIMGMSSFKEELNIRQFTKTYYHYSDTQNFSTTPPDPLVYDTNCASDDAAWCKVTYTGPEEEDLPTASSFGENAIPTPLPGVTRSNITANAGYYELP